MLNTNSLANAHEQLASLGQANVEKAMRLSNIVLSTAERFASLNMELGKKILDQNVETVKALTEAKDPKKLAEISTSLAQPAVDNSLNAARSLYDAAVLTQNEVQSFVEEQLLEFNKQLCANLDKIAKTNPAGEPAINAIKNVLTSATAAYDSVAKTAKKVSTELAEAGVAAAANSAKAAGEVVSQATKQAAPAAKK
ncbi:phasin family protein [Aquaspirillum soli]|mgnify:CR=1 FL=1|jgi:phasin family protein